MRSSINTLFLAVTLVSVAGCFSGYRSHGPHTLRAHRGTFVKDVVLTGELRASRGEEVAVPRLPQWQSSVKWLAADGAEVHQGDRVVELDNSAFASNLDGKSQSVAQAQQELQQKEAEWKADTLQKELDVAARRVDYDKAKLEAAVPADVLSRREFEDRETKFRRASVELAKATDLLKAQHSSVSADRDNLLLKLGKAERDLKTAQDAIEALILRAPRDGIVVLRDHPWEGRRLQEGDSVFVGMPLAFFPEVSSLQVAADLADVDDGRIGPGMPATVVLDAYPSTSFPGRISSISAVAQESSRTSLRRSFNVIVSLDRLDPARMRPGLSARVTVHSMTQHDSLIAPRAAIDFSASHPRARLAAGKLVDVKVLACNAQECSITSGLSDGDELSANEGWHG